MQSEVGMTAVADAVADARRGISGAYDRLVEALVRVDASGDEGRAWTALGLLVDRPPVLLRIDMLSRSDGWGSRQNEVAAQVRGAAAGPIALALGSMDPDGQLRERAVRSILTTTPARELVAFLALRTADPVRQVRDRARAGLALLLADDNEARRQHDLRLALSMAPSLARRLRGGFLHGQVVAALLTTSRERAWRLAQASSPDARRLVLDLGIAHGWWPIDDLVEVALREPDRRVRTRAAEALVRDAVWTRRRKTIDRLSAARYPDVRANAVTGLVRLGLDRVATAFLDDPAGTVRAIARDAADRTGVKAVDHYRSAVTNAAVTTGTVAGLAETGVDADVRLVAPLLRHDAPRIRVAAVRAHRALDPGAGHALIDLLDDPSPAVLREVTVALRNAAVPPELARVLLDDAASVDRRRAGYRLLSWGVVYDQLRAALVASADPDPALARRARGDLRRIVRDATGQTWRRRPRPDLRVTTDQLAELRRLVPVAAWTVGADATRELSAWLDAVPATG